MSKLPVTMRFAIHNTFFGSKLAETELVQRMLLAAQNIGWEAIEIETIQEIETYEPDFVLVTHFSTPKLSRFPTYGCMWNPPIFFERFLENNGERYSRNFDKIKDKFANILSYDGYLSSSPQFDKWLNQQLGKTFKKYFTVPFFTSCNFVEYIRPSFSEPRLVYIGSNWDGTRFKQLFKKLDQWDWMEVYGSNWDYLKKSYKGSLPFDGVSVLETLRKAGVGLCLHLPEHKDAEMPSMRIFEIVASGAIAICSEHQFIRDVFGDNVLYIDLNANGKIQAIQIIHHMNWIKSNPQEASRMSEQAYKLFIEKYTLEKLMLSIVPHHQQLLKEKGFIKESRNQSAKEPMVEFIVRVGGRSLSTIKRCLDSIANQTYTNVGVILVEYKSIEGLSELLEKYSLRMPIKTIVSVPTGFRSSQLKEGINAITGDYFGVLDDDDLLYPNHTFILVSLLEENNLFGIAYSGAIRTEEDAVNKIIKKNLAYFCAFDIKKIAKFQNYITSNSFIARSLLVKDIYVDDPKLPIREDFYLILNLCCKSIFLFSYEITNEFFWRINRTDNTIFEYDNPSDMAVDKILASDLNKASEMLTKMFWDREIMYVDNPADTNIKVVKLSKIRFGQGINFRILGDFRLYGFLRKIYLKISGGGRYNKNPNFVAKLLIRIKDFLLR